MRVFEGKALYFCRGWLFFNPVGNCLLWKCKSVGVVLLKMQFCRYLLFKWDLVGCFALNTKKNVKKKNSPNSLKGGSAEKKELCGWWG